MGPEQRRTEEEAAPELDEFELGEGPAGVQVGAEGLEGSVARRTIYSDVSPLGSSEQSSVKLFVAWTRASQGVDRSRVRQAGTPDEETEQ